jgi:hypothetical protein
MIWLSLACIAAGVGVMLYITNRVRPGSRWEGWWLALLGVLLLAAVTLRAGSRPP